MKRKTKGECPVLPKRSRPVQRDDPLQGAAHASVGRPKGKKLSAATEMMDHGGISQSDKSQLTSTTSEQALLTHSQLMDDKFSHAKKGQKPQGCGQCEACTKADCGKCRYCLDKKKFGGKERLKQRCIHRKCRKIHIRENKLSESRKTLNSVEQHVEASIKSLHTITSQILCTSNREINLVKLSLSASSIFSYRLMLASTLRLDITEDQCREISVTPPSPSIFSIQLLLSEQNRSLDRIIGDGEMLFCEQKRRSFCGSRDVTR
ncbi:histone-lysine N-methyltransferase 2B-like [Dysidea avara]|uniref:histone-lysine N-methyltransferase 2B-like n=1 Tax=Dysidea avara TaxID=196820 RepID=UPI0033320D32